MKCKCHLETNPKKVNFKSIKDRIFLRCKDCGSIHVLRQNRFMDNKDGTILDTKTNLIWQNEDDGIKRTSKEAIEYVNSLTLWRLPTVEELLSLVDYSLINPCADKVFNFRCYWYWSNTIYALNPNYNWAVSFFTGNSNWDLWSNQLYVRCVRSV